MTHFKSNVPDALFNVFDLWDTESLLSQPPFDDLDAETLRSILREAAALATGPIADSFVPGDRTPPQFDPAAHAVSMAPEVKNAWDELRKGAWWQLETIPELGGQVLPSTVVWSVAEQFLGANAALYIYTVYAPFAGIIWRHGTDGQKKLAQLMVDRGWASTMMLTESEAGSDVGAGTTKATENADGTWNVTGVKRFISSGDHDLTDNIVHLVLARREGGPAGSKGLSLFIVPKYHVDLETGELGERNGVFVTNIESKLGLTASATCEVRLGEDPAVPAVGYLLGDVHRGIAQMFEAIEHSRMFVGAKSVATLSSAYQHALDFARTRVQSADLADRGSADAQRVAIIAHPDVRRILLTVKSYVEGMRALVMYLAHVQDRIAVAQAAGADAAEDVALNDLLLPVVKAVCSERANELLPQTLQVLGGSGYLKDYPIEQYLRDAKIDTIYEGTTAIQAQDFLFRKLGGDQGRTLQRQLTTIRQLCADAPVADLEPQYAALDDAAAALGQLAELLLARTAEARERPEAIYTAGEHATRLLMCTGDVLIGYLLLRQAEAAEARLRERDDEQSRDVRAGKFAAARHFCVTALPQTRMALHIVQGPPSGLMDVPESAF